MAVIISGDREGVLIALRALDPKKWTDLKAGIGAIQNTRWDEYRVELKDIKKKWFFWGKACQEIWITSGSKTISVFYSKREH